MENSYLWGTIKKFNLLVQTTWDFLFLYFRNIEMWLTAKEYEGTYWDKWGEVNEGQIATVKYKSSVSAVVAAYFGETSGIKISLSNRWYIACKCSWK